jgi:DNA-directed RNA polymerase specialized sigma24 family protein
MAAAVTKDVFSPPATMTNQRARFLLQAFKYERQLRDYLRRSTRNFADAEDLLQETYARLLRQGDSDTLVVQSIRSFAFTIARRVGN